MKIYRVGGSVRDELLGRPSFDHDHVVVGTTPEVMVALGFRPVGRDFPVFLHPETHEEYALARTERKSGRGYHGFVFHTDPTVTLEEDLRRRDLTINAMARDADGALVDPFGGQRDLEARILRHVSDAFAEDPLRVLRVARFAARLGFRVAPETMSMMRSLVAGGEVAELPVERVWQEVSRGLGEAVPSRMFEVMRECAALAAILPEVDWLFGRPDPEFPLRLPDLGVLTLAGVDLAAQTGRTLGVRFAVLTHRFDGGEPAVGQACQRLRVPVDVQGLATRVAALQQRIRGAGRLDAPGTVGLLRESDALRRPGRFAELLDAADVIEEVTGGQPADPAARTRLLAARARLAAIDYGAIATAHAADPAGVPGAIRTAQEQSLAGL